MTKKLFCAAWAFCLILALQVNAKEAPPPTFFINSYSFTDSLHAQILSVCKNILIEKGWTISKDFDFEWFVEAKEIGDELVISAVATSRLPKPVVEAGGKNELFYTAIEWDEDKLPAEEKHIREYVSKDYLNNFRLLEGHELFVGKKDDLCKLCNKVVDSMLKKCIHIM